MRAGQASPWRIGALGDAGDVEAINEAAMFDSIDVEGASKTCPVPAAQAQSASGRLRQFTPA
jgi:hypothetical protein